MTKRIAIAKIIEHNVGFNMINNLQIDINNDSKYPCLPEIRNIEEYLDNIKFEE